MIRLAQTSLVALNEFVRLARTMIGVTSGGSLLVPCAFYAT
jgi:hypothetical protein